MGLIIGSTVCTQLIHSQASALKSLYTLFHRYGDGSLITSSIQTNQLTLKILAISLKAGIITASVGGGCALVLGLAFLLNKYRQSWQEKETNSVNPLKKFAQWLCTHKSEIVGISIISAAVAVICISLGLIACGSIGLHTTNLQLSSLHLNGELYTNEWALLRSTITSIQNLNLYYGLLVGGGALGVIGGSVVGFGAFFITLANKAEKTGEQRRDLIYQLSATQDERNKL